MERPEWPFFVLSMKITSVMVPAPRLIAAHGGMKALATTMTVAAFIAAASQSLSARIFTPPCDKGICCGVTTTEHRSLGSLGTSMKLPSRQIKKALIAYEGVIVIGTPSALQSLLTDLEDSAEIAREGEFPFNMQLVAVMLTKID